LQGSEQIGPQPHQGVLHLGQQALPFQMGGAAMPAPQGLMVMADLLALGQAVRQRRRAGFATGEAQAGAAQQPADLHG
jgi:hypothetical protein